MALSTEPHQPGLETALKMYLSPGCRNDNTNIYWQVYEQWVKLLAVVSVCTSWICSRLCFWAQQTRENKSQFSVRFYLCERASWINIKLMISVLPHQLLSTLQVHLTVLHTAEMVLICKQAVMGPHIFLMNFWLYGNVASKTMVEVTQMLDHFRIFSLLGSKLQVYQVPKSEILDH